MYARVFKQILDSSISRNHLTRLVFIDCLLLADEDGVIDITADAIARRTNVPLDIVSEAIKSLSEPDPDSRSGEEEGRRLVLLDPHRNWGWRIVNYEKYSTLRTREDKRAYDHERYVRNKRVRQNKENASDSEISQDSTSVHFFPSISPTKTKTKTKKHSCSSDDERLSISLIKHTVEGSGTAKDEESSAGWGKPQKQCAFVERFWPIWPRKVAKAAAEKAWLKHASTPELADRIIEAARVQAPQLTRNGLEFCPYPATWLNDRRFEDDSAEPLATDTHEETPRYVL